jgi:hypothetical protein
MASMSSHITNPHSTLAGAPSLNAQLAALVEAGDVAGAIDQALGAFFAIHEQVQLLRVDAVRGDDTLVVEIANMIAEESGEMMQFLDRPGGWSR